jgi:serpin B
LGLVIQKTFVDVDEKGTEAAAATVAMAAAGAAPRAPPKPIVVRADRPFLFLIRDVVRNRTLFIGRLAQPKPA